MICKLNGLNLYAGIGGNRKYWKDINITAVEINPCIAQIYKDNFPNDKIIIGDAHEYLLNHFKEFDFIWSSPPCQSHSRTNFYLNKQNKIRYPDLKLYEEIIILKQFSNFHWVIENVQPYYLPIIPGKKIGRHLFWSNFFIPNTKNNFEYPMDSRYDLEKLYGFNVDKYKCKNKRTILRNCVHPELGLHVFNSFVNHKKKLNIKIGGLFEHLEY